MASSSSDADTVSGEEMTLAVKWAGKDFTVQVSAEDTVGELKRRICELTNVLPKRQKLLNLKSGNKPAQDSALIFQLSVKPGAKIMMIGTVEDEILTDPMEVPGIVDDFEIPDEDTVDIKDSEINKQKLQRRIKQYKLNLLNPCREGKKLLVLDIDYTIFDHRSPAENPSELMRPYLHEFLMTAYRSFDIIIWSATSMKWIEVKMKELGVLSNPNYKILALMDHLAMITVQSKTHGVFDCKPLGVIWGKLPQFYSRQNTIMFDDLKRNFVMNPENGLVIRPFQKAHLNRTTDQELKGLSYYLLCISILDDFTGLDHRRWMEYNERHKSSWGG